MAWQGKERKNREDGPQQCCHLEAATQCERLLIRWVLGGVCVCVEADVCVCVLSERMDGRRIMLSLQLRKASDTFLLEPCQTVRGVSGPAA